MRPARVVALVPAAGRGDRLAAGLPKAFVPLLGRPLLWHCVQGLLRAGCVDQVVVAVGAQHCDQARSMMAEVAGQVRIVAGAATRVGSVRAALDAASDAEVVLVHDAARCLAPIGVIQAVVAAVLAGQPAVVPVLPVVDTIKRVDPEGRVSHTLERSALRVVQTPQGFAADLLRRAHRRVAVGSSPDPRRNDPVTDDPVTDDAGLVERLGETVTTVPGHPYAFKITTPVDLRIAQAFASEPEAGTPVIPATPVTPVAAGPPVP